MGFPFLGQWSHFVLLFSRMVCTSALSSEKSDISGLHPATFLDLPLRVLEAWTVFLSILVTEDRIICLIWGQLYYLDYSRLYRWLPPFLAPLALDCWSSLESCMLKRTFFPFLGEGRLIAEVMIDFCWVISA